MLSKPRLEPADPYGKEDSPFPCPNFSRPALPISPAALLVAKREWYSSSWAPWKIVSHSLNGVFPATLDAPLPTKLPSLPGMASSWQP
eukprot:1139731-Pelagomonas_calceolata.AAC.3